MRVFLAVALVMLTLTATVDATQVVTLSGRVIDARTGEAIAGVDVTVDHQPLSARTDAEGRFSLSVPPGEYTLVVSPVGFAVLRQSVTVVAGRPAAITLTLSEGAGSFEERVTVAGTPAAGAGTAPGVTVLHGRALQALRGITLDDPLRALHAAPSVSATDDFYTEFSVRGQPFRQLGMSVDGIPTQFLMHSVYGITDGGSIAMINSDAIGALTLAPGGYPQRFGRRTGAALEVLLREGSRETVRGRVGLSGTSAAIVAEGPIGAQRGSWLVSARRSYLDWLLRRIDSDGTIAFGFSDVAAKAVVDINARHQLQALAIGGASGFDEEPDGLTANDEAGIRGRSWLAGLSWRFTPSSSVVVTQRLYTTGLDYTNRNISAEVLDDRNTHDAGWRADATIAIHPRVLVETGADAQLLRARHTRQRALNNSDRVSPMASYARRGHAASAYLQTIVSPGTRATLTVGGRLDDWGPSSVTTLSPWLTARVALSSRLRLEVGTGVYRQFPDLDTLHGIGGSRGLRPETARHVDVAVSQLLPYSTQLQVTWYAREERDGLWRQDLEPRRGADGLVVPGRGDAPWTNALRGSARGVEVVWRRDSADRLSGWVGYSFGRHRQSVPGESFWSDHDQRHAVSLAGQYRISNQTSVGIKFRYGSNYPVTGYITEQPRSDNAPPLFGGGPALFLTVSDARNTLRLPAYARVDLRADRTLTVAGRRVTVFLEVANALNRRNLRNVPYGIDRTGRVFGATDSLLPVVPSAGFVIDF